MKKPLALLLALVLTLCLCACEKDAETPNASDPTGNSSVSSNPTSNSSIPSHTHAYTQEVIAPACTANGYTLNTCECGDSYISDEVAAPGHTWSPATCTTPKTCTACEATEGHLADHDFNNGKCSVCEVPDPDYRAYNTGKWVRKAMVEVRGEEYLMIQTLCFDSTKGLTWSVRYFEHQEEPDPDFMEDLLNDGYMVKYKNEYYQHFGMGEAGELDLGNSNDTQIRAEMLYYDSYIVLKRSAGNKLKVTTVGGDAASFIGKLASGNEFTWEE